MGNGQECPCYGGATNSRADALVRSWFVCLCVGGLAGCGDPDGKASKDTQRVRQTPRAIAVEGAIPSPAINPSSELGSIRGNNDALEFHRRLTDELSNVDPGGTEWASEAFSEVVTAEMKELSKLLLHPEDLKAAFIQSKLAGDFVFGPLRPTDLESVYAGDDMRVKRSTGDEKPTALVPGSAESFTHALQTLVSPLAAASDKRAKFKTMHVELKGDNMLTKMLFEMRGRNPDGWLQMTSTWHCQWTQQEPPRLRSVQVTDYQETTRGASGSIEFADVAPRVLSGTSSYRDQLAKSFDYWRARSDKSLVADLLGAQGVIVGDVNGDNLDDVYVLQPGGLPNRLYLHELDGTARDVSAESGVDVLDFCRSALFIDLDNDGDQDLALGMAWKLFLMENDGTGQFTPRGGFPTDGQVNSMAAADYDNDGDLDIYVCGRDASGEIKAEEGALGIPMPYYDANNGGRNMLFRNDGSFALQDATNEVGMDVNNRRFSLACAWEDFDNDGDQDLYVSNDFGRNNLWRNDAGPKPGSRTFTDIAGEAKVLDIGPGMSAAWGDYNNDGNMDLYVANMWSNAGNRITLQKQFLPGANAATKKQARRHARGNSVYVNDGNGTFRDHTQTSGANMARWAWSSNFIDLNNDGRQDLVVANGMITAGDAGDL